MRRSMKSRENITFGSLRIDGSRATLTLFFIQNSVEEYMMELWQVSIRT